MKVVASWAAVVALLGCTAFQTPSRVLRQPGSVLVRQNIESSRGDRALRHQLMLRAKKAEPVVTTTSKHNVVHVIIKTLLLLACVAAFALQPASVSASSGFRRGVTERFFKWPYVKYVYSIFLSGASVNRVRLWARLRKEKDSIRAANAELRDVEKKCLDDLHRRNAAAQKTIKEEDSSRLDL
mmetsp:Transcript_15864/g.47974  ORF Transcript_15864/g.47974 Transcript_15864/m.47974 type:complete len:183 (-) Transcript_15864:1865-2413(-)